MTKQRLLTDDFETVVSVEVDIDEVDVAVVTVAELVAEPVAELDVKLLAELDVEPLRLDEVAGSVVVELMLV